MATFAQIKEVRLTIADPPGFIDFQQVANFAALPVSPVAQTSYTELDTGTYWDKTSGSWLAVQLRVSDSRIGTWIDSFGLDGAVRKSIEAVLSMLPGELMIVRNADGAESTEFIKLLDLQTFYQNWLDRLTPEASSLNTGRYMRTKTPRIAAGNV